MNNEATYSVSVIITKLFIFRAQKTKHKHQTPLANKYLREEDPEFAKRICKQFADDKRFIPSSSEDEAPDFDYLLKALSTGSHFLLKSEKEKFVESSAQFSRHFVIDTNVLNLAFKSIPFNERHDIKNVEWSKAELNMMQEEAQANKKIYCEALEKILLEERQKSEEKLVKKVETMTIAKEAKPISIQSTPAVGTAKDKAEIQDWLDDILDM
jgi:hypothetical protein